TILLFSVAVYCFAFLDIQSPLFCFEIISHFVNFAVQFMGTIILPLIYNYSENLRQL
ncbi:MAG: hypothetical protein ACI8ZF_000905, partial [Candidatus Midichloriaceae bacterium]